MQFKKITMDAEIAKNLISEKKYFLIKKSKFVLADFFFILQFVFLKDDPNFFVSLWKIYLDSFSSRAAWITARVSTADTIVHSVRH